MIDRESQATVQTSNTFMRLLRAILFNLLVVIAVMGAFSAGFLYHQQQIGRNFPILQEAYQLLDEHGLKAQPTPPGLEYGMIRGMVQAYDDPYTLFLEPPQNELEGNRLEGRYGGIGADLKPDAQGSFRLYPYLDGPAATAGVLDGDLLLKVDDLVVTQQLPAETVLAALRGPVGETVRLEIGRAAETAPLSMSIEFAEYPLPSVTWRPIPEEPRLGVIQVNLIAASTGDEIQHAVEDLSKRGVTHYALDLRDNPGGLLDSGVDIARLFLKDGLVMEQQYRGREAQRYSVEKPGPLADIPLVVLINQGSASAAEIAAGALKARRRAMVIGEPSYGKDSIQLVFTLQDGSSMHVTSARWWIPGLQETIHENGIQPDIPVDTASVAPGADAYIQAAIRQFFGSS
jgi:carboxyl-terminal processing protease